MRPTRGRVIMAWLLVLGLLVGLVAFTLVGPVVSTPTSPLTDLTTVSDLQAQFNQDAGVPRLVLLLSPT